MWKEKQILKGGNDKSLSLLIDLLGGFSKQELNLLIIKSEKNVKLKKNLESLSKSWDKHIKSSIPIQYLSGF